MNCEPFGCVVNDSRAERAFPFWYEAELLAIAAHGKGNRARRGTAEWMRISRAMDADDARYMEAVRR